MAWRVVGLGIFGLGLVAGALASPARPGGSVRADQATGDPEMLRVVLAGVRGADPVACELAVIALDGRSYGWSEIRADVEGTAPGGVPLRELARWVMRPPRDPALLPLLRDALVGPDPCAARIAVRLLGRTGSREAAAVLREAARDADTATRRNAAIGLGLAERPETRPELERLLGDASPTVRAAAAWALGELEDRAAVPALIRSLVEDGDPTTRRAAAWALGRID